MNDPREFEISVVVSGRNDNWNGTFNRVAPFVMSHNAAVLSRAVQRFEQIFVEWAPLEDRPLLSERLVDVGPQVRCFVVPRAIHDGFRPGIAFLQYHARNVGIRRALGRRILATNADILLTPDIVRAMLEAPDGLCLRAPRYDVDLTVLDQATAEAVLRFCADGRNRVAEHEIVSRHGDQALAWFENAAGDFACMDREDWHRCGGFHERVDASMGVDAELIGQACQLGIEVLGCDYPVFHVDHPEQQAGRLHMPPFSETGYDNPKDWGLHGVEFPETVRRVYHCSPELAGSFERVDWPPPLEWPEEFDGLTQIHDRAITREYDAIVFCGLCDAVVGFSLYLELAADQPRVWDDGAEETAAWQRELKWESWPDLRPNSSEGLSEPGMRVLYVAMACTAAHATLIERGAIHMRDLLVVEPGVLTTLSPLLCAMQCCPPGFGTVVLLGFGRRGRVIAERLRHHLENMGTMEVWDDSPDSRRAARSNGLKIVTPDQIVGSRGGQLVVVTPVPEAGGEVLAMRLKDAGLIEGRDWITCPFPAAPQWSRRPLPIGSPAQA